MIRITELRLPISHAPEALEEAILQRLKISAQDLIRFNIFKRSYDARKNVALAFIYTVDLSVKDEEKLLKQFSHDIHIRPSPDMSYHFVAKASQVKSEGFERPVVIGFGPCGIFAALVLAQMGFKPIVLERGKPVRERTQDTWGLWRKNVLNPESNVQFGEGGAGTFSDGKLWSQIKDPKFYGRKVIAEFIKAGAPEEIRYDDSDGVPVIMPESLLGMQQRRKAELRAAAKSMFSPDEFVLDNQSDTIVADDINRKMKWGYTLLHFAAVEGNEVEIDRLLSLGADKTITDNSGKMPYQKAERKGFVDLAKKLMP